MRIFVVIPYQAGNDEDKELRMAIETLYAPNHLHFQPDSIALPAHQP